LDIAVNFVDIFCLCFSGSLCCAMHYADRITRTVAYRQRTWSNTCTAEIWNVFTMRRYASVVYALIVCLSVRPSICMSHATIVSKWLNVGSCKQRLTTKLFYICIRDSSFLMPKISAKFQRGHPNGGAKLS